ncbi:MAG TPA: response regulator [Candidatus Binatia bacterium]|nr:response regulator [Candidatus Binatia bacterium]
MTVDLWGSQSGRLFAEQSNPVVLQKAQKHLAAIVRKIIFVVDDDPGMRLGVKRLLNKHGFETELFDSVEDFHERADVRRPDCLVLDIKLKNGSGIDLRRELTNSGVSVPAIFITANDTDHTRKAAADAGCAAYLTKPFSGKTLIDAIEKATGSNRMS